MFIKKKLITPFNSDKKRLDRQRSIKIDEEIEKTKNENKKRLELLFIDIDPETNTIHPKELKLHFKRPKTSDLSLKRLSSTFVCCYIGKCINKSTYTVLDDSVWLSDNDVTENGETLHKYKNFRGFSLKDFRSQNSAKHKWIRMLDCKNISMLVIMIDLCWYDQFYTDEAGVVRNKLLKCIEFVRQVSDFKAFKDTDILLYFYNKEDFTERLKCVEFSKCFVEYKGDDTFDKASEFLDDMLCADRKSSSTYVHYLATKEIADDINMNFLMSTSVWVLIRSMMKLYHML